MNWNLKKKSNKLYIINHILSFCFSRLYFTDNVLIKRHPICFVDTHDCACMWPVLSSHGHQEAEGYWVGDHATSGAESETAYSRVTFMKEIWTCGRWPTDGHS